jgi:hypothetical protein
MSADTPQVRHPLYGIGREIDRSWAPVYNDQDREEVVIERPDGSTYRATASELEEL